MYLNASPPLPTLIHIQGQPHPLYPQNVDNFPILFFNTFLRLDLDAIWIEPRRDLDWTATRFGLNCDAIRIEPRRESDWTATRVGLNRDASQIEREALFSRAENCSKMGEK